MPYNPIHPDPAAARATGLGVPIESACVRAGARIIPRAEVKWKGAEAVGLALAVLCEGTSGLVGRAQVPLPGATS